jgi:hypothetical protein
MMSLGEKRKKAIVLTPEPHDRVKLDLVSTKHISESEHLFFLIIAMLISYSIDYSITYNMR